MKTQYKGYTLIELVFVVSIIAILVTIGLTHRLALQQEARFAKMQALHGTLRLAAALTRARCEIDLLNGSAIAGACGNHLAPQVTMDGQMIDMVNKYPQALTTAAGKGILAAAGLWPGATVATAVDGVYATGGGVAAGSTLTINAVGAAGTCQITYTSPAAGSAPTITLNATQAGC